MTETRQLNCVICGTRFTQELVDEPDFTCGRVECRAVLADRQQERFELGEPELEDGGMFGSEAQVARAALAELGRVKRFTSTRPLTLPEVHIREDFRQRSHGVSVLAELAADLPDAEAIEALRLARSWLDRVLVGADGPSDIRSEDRVSEGGRG